MLKKIHVSKRALSPIFATLVILGVVTVLFIPVFYWATSKTVQAKDEWEATGVTATESVVIEEVSLGIGQTYCIVYLRNIGKTTVSINDVIIEKGSGVMTYQSSLGELVTTNPETGSVQETASEGELLAIRINNLKGLTLENNQLYTVKVFTDKGIGEDFPIVL